jgi:cell division protease FtsH
MTTPRHRSRSTTGLLVLLLLLFGLMAGALTYLAPSSPGAALTVDDLLDRAATGGVERAIFLDQDRQVVGTSNGQNFHVATSDATTPGLLEALTDGGARVTVDPQPTKAAVRLLATVLLPVLVLANLFGLLFVLARGGDGAVGDIRAFSTLGDRRGRAVEPPAVRFDDVAGADEAVAELREVVAYLTDPGQYAALGAAPPKGVLLFGPPGTGKTLIARATAGEAGVPFFSVAGAEFVESLVGVGAARVRDLFARVRDAAPAILFIDEIDAAGRRRGAGDASGGSHEREQTLNQLLVEIDGFDVASGIVVMGATNRPDILDPALLRPGRFDRHVVVDQPDVVGREEILRIHARGKPLAPDVDLAAVARRTPGFTGADLANVLNEAALLAIREGHREVGQSNVTEAVQRVLSGPQRRGRLLTDAERQRIASHEAGHAILAAALGHADDVQRVSIVARGRSLGSVHLGTDRDAVLLTQTQLHAQLATALGGRAAEEVLFGEPSTGSDDDLATATALARDLAARHGMTEELGRVRLLGPDAALAIDPTTGLDQVSSRVRDQVDATVRDLVDAGFAAAVAALERNRDVLEALVERLLAEETLEGLALADLLGKVATPAAP